MLRRPDLMTRSLLLSKVFRNNITNSLLEMKWTLLHLGVKLAVDKDTSVEVLLRVHAQVLVLRHDALVDVADEVEVLVGGVLVTVDLVAHYTLSRAGRGESLHEEEIGTRSLMLVFIII